MIAKTYCVIRMIQDETLLQKLAETDPAVVAIMPGLALRLNASNDKIEKLWSELQIYKSLKLPD